MFTLHVVSYGHAGRSVVCPLLSWWWVWRNGVIVAWYRKGWGGECCDMPWLVLLNAWLVCEKCVVSAENQKHTKSRWLATF